MDLSILSGETMEFGDDDSFLFTRAEEMDDEVTQIFKRWKMNNPPLPKKDIANETFDSRTFTRPPKRRTFNINDHQKSGITPTAEDMQSIESGIASINLQVGGAITPLSMQKSWLLDVSPPSSICTSMDFQNTDNMLNSLITSSDFTNVSFLLNGTDDKRNIHNQTVTLDANATLIANNPSNVSRNLMNFTFDVTRNAARINSTTCIHDSEPPLKEIGIENADIQLNESIEDLGKNLTFNKYEEGDLTWNKIQNHQLTTVVQSTPVHNSEIDQHDKLKKNFDDDTLSPISSLRAQLEGENENEDDKEEEMRNNEVILRSLKNRKLIDQIRLDEYRNSMEDQCEFLLNEETIKLSSRVYGGESFENLGDCRKLNNSTHIVDDEKEFDKMLASFNVKKSAESEKLLQSVDSIKQRHSLINMEKQRESKHDNKAQYDSMTKSSHERLLNRRSRLYDDVNLQLQKQQTNGSDNVENDSTVANGAENDGNENGEKNIQNDRDRFKTIKLNKPRLQTGMVIIDTEEPAASEVSPGTNKERQNQINQQKQEEVEKEFKKPSLPQPSRMSKFGFGLQRPSYSSRNNLNLPLKANSTDSLDNDGIVSNNPTKRVDLKSPMGVKSKSIHNLMFNGAQQGIRMTSDLNTNNARSQLNLKAPRASSLVRPSNVDNGLKLPQNDQQKNFSANPSSRKTSLVRPSSGYYGNYNNTKRLDSDSESYSLSSSSASSRNSVHLSLAPSEQPYNYQQKSIEDLNVKKVSNVSGAIPKPTMIGRPMAGSGLPRPQLKSRLPGPRR